MTSSIGNNRQSSFRFDHRGFTFFELLVAVAILALGMVMIYRSFLISLDVQQHLRNRLFAEQLLEDRVATIKYFFQIEQKIPPDQRSAMINSEVGYRTVPFTLEVVESEGTPLVNMTRLDIRLSWPEQKRSFTFNRTLLLFHPEDEKPQGAS